MKETLDDNTRQDLIEYRLKRADETLIEAEYNAKGAYFNAAVNRLYYACFYAASALMLKFYLDASTHKGVRSQLGLHFITKRTFRSQVRLYLFPIISSSASR